MKRIRNRQLALSNASPKYPLRVSLLRFAIALVSAIALSSCSFAGKELIDNKPKLNFSEFFNGKLCAWGLVKSRNGKPNRKFVADIDATTKGNVTTLDEQFIFDDGALQQRVWQFEEKNGLYFGTAGDVIGTAVGKVFGDSLHLTYQLNIPVDDSDWKISMNDWLHLVDSETLMGTTEMTKWGFDVGRIDIVMQKRDAGTECFSGARNG